MFDFCMGICIVFLIAIVQDFFITAWTRAIAEKKKLSGTGFSFVTSYIGASIYGEYMHGAGRGWHRFAWALGSAVGTLLLLWIEDYIEKRKKNGNTK